MIVSSFVPAHVDLGDTFLERTATAVATMTNVALGQPSNGSSTHPGISGVEAVVTDDDTAQVSCRLSSSSLNTN
jgi:hypothetical protein